MDEYLPTSITQVLKEFETTHEILSALMPTLGTFLKCDRCFLYLRNPQTGYGRVPFCWTRSSDIPSVFGEHWRSEPEYLEREDPMFAAALRKQPTIFVEDVETASPMVLSRQFEAKHFGHRALIHAHLCLDDQLWGVLQPCIFSYPRVWTQSEKDLIHQITEIITPIAVKFINSQSELK